MSPLEIVYYSVLICAMVSGVGITAALIYKQLQQSKMEFEIKLASAQAQSASKDTSSFEQLREDINFIISFYAAHEATFVLEAVKDENTNKELLIEELTADVSAKTFASLSDEMKRQFTYYATVPQGDINSGQEDFLTYFIRKETFSKVVTVVNKMK